MHRIDSVIVCSSVCPFCMHVLLFFVVLMTTYSTKYLKLPLACVLMTLRDVLKNLYKSLPGKPHILTLNTTRIHVILSVRELSLESQKKGEKRKIDSPSFLFLDSYAVLASNRRAVELFHEVAGEDEDDAIAIFEGVQAQRLSDLLMAELECQIEIAIAS